MMRSPKMKRRLDQSGVSHKRLRIDIPVSQKRDGCPLENVGKRRCVRPDHELNMLREEVLFLRKELQSAILRGEAHRQMVANQALKIIHLESLLNRLHVGVRSGIEVY